MRLPLVQPHPPEGVGVGERGHFVEQRERAEFPFGERGFPARDGQRRRGIERHGPGELPGEPRPPVRRQQQAHGERGKIGAALLGDTGAELAFQGERAVLFRAQPCLREIKRAAPRPRLEPVHPPLQGRPRREAHRAPLPVEQPFRRIVLARCHHQARFLERARAPFQFKIGDGHSPQRKAGSGRARTSGSGRRGRLHRVGPGLFPREDEPQPRHVEILHHARTREETQAHVGAKLVRLEL